MKVKHDKVYQVRKRNLMETSDILNDVPVTSVKSFVVADKETCKRLEKLYTKEYIPGQEKKLQDVVKEIEQYRSRMIKEGAEDPESYPPELMNKKSDILAKMDVLGLELDAIRKKLVEHEKQEESVFNELILEHGPRGFIKLKDGFVAEIDGQKCELVDGVPVIVEKDSPYRGYSVANYKTWIVKPYLKFRDKMSFLEQEIRNELFRKGVTDKSVLLLKLNEGKNNLINKNATFKRLFKIEFRGKKYPGPVASMQRYIP